MKPIKSQKIWWFLVLTLSACATPTITFNVPGQAKITAVSLDSLEREGLFLGETPLTIDTAKIKGKVLKISKKGKIPVYWVMPDISGQMMQAQLTLLDEPKAPAPDPVPGSKEAIAITMNEARGDTKAKVNRVLRLLMRAYQALAARQLQLATELAESAARIDPELAAPLVIKGIALMQAGNAGAARAALSNAQALDPEDRDINTLLQALR